MKKEGENRNIDVVLNRMLAINWLPSFFNCRVSLEKFENTRLPSVNKLSQKQTSTSGFEAPEKFWKAKSLH